MRRRARHGAPEEIARFALRSALSRKGDFQIAPNGGLETAAPWWRRQDATTDCAASIVAPTVSLMSNATPDPAVDALWYKDAVIYELHVKTFHDSDGDGIGDFRGTDVFEKKAGKWMAVASQLTKVAKE